MLNLFTFLVEKLAILSYLNFFDSKCLSDDGKRGSSSTISTSNTTSNTTTSSSTTTTSSRRPQGLHRGDLLEVPRTLFSHFGIYLGDGRVAHLIPDILPALTADAARIGTVITNRRLILGCVSRRATVRVDSLEDFAYGSELRVNAMDARVEQRALPAEEVARRAEGLVGAVPYSLLWHNCEHLVTHCRYGRAVSRQTDQFCECLKSIIRDQRTILVTLLLGITSIVCFGMVPLTTLPTVLISFTLWMAG
ncbi:unnamed protein product [Merluccius merluccius]